MVIEVEEIIALATAIAALVAFVGMLYRRSKDQAAEREAKHQEEMARAVREAEFKAALEYAERERKRIESEFQAHAAQSPELIRQITALEMQVKAQDAKIDALDQKFDRRMDSLKDDLERMLGK